MESASDGRLPAEQQPPPLECRPQLRRPPNSLSLPVRLHDDDDDDDQASACCSAARSPPEVGATANCGYAEVAAGRGNCERPIGGKPNKWPPQETTPASWSSCFNLGNDGRDLHGHIATLQLGADDYASPAPLHSASSLLPTRVVIVKKAIKNQDTTDESANLPELYLDGRWVALGLSSASSPSLPLASVMATQQTQIDDCRDCDNPTAPRMRRSQTLRSEFRGRPIHLPLATETTKAANCIGEEEHFHAAASELESRGEGRNLPSGIRKQQQGEERKLYLGANVSPGCSEQYAEDIRVDSLPAQRDEVKFQVIVEQAINDSTTTKFAARNSWQDKTSQVVADPRKVRKARVKLRNKQISSIKSSIEEFLADLRGNQQELSLRASKLIGHLGASLSKDLGSKSSKIKSEATSASQSKLIEAEKSFNSQQRQRHRQQQQQLESKVPLVKFQVSRQSKIASNIHVARSQAHVERIGGDMSRSSSANDNNCKSSAANQYQYPCNQNRCSRDLDDRRSTYCSSFGNMTTTDPNCDSSISSSPSLSNLNNSNNNTRRGNRIRGAMKDSRDSTSPLDEKQSKQANCKSIAVDLRAAKKSKKPDDVLAREFWGQDIEFLLAVIGFAVDLGNVWRFPYICYKNGGGAFLIPYSIMFVLGGLPIFLLELSLGQYHSSGCLTIWLAICPIAKGIGYAMCVLNFFTSLYYNTIISWAVFFFTESFSRELPWTTCDNSWNSPNCKTISQRQAMRLNATTSLAQPQSQSSPTKEVYTSPTRDYFEREVLQSQYSEGIHDLGSIRTPLAVYLLIVYTLIYFAIWKGVKSTGKAVWITALLPYFVLIPLLFRGVVLDGAILGIKYYLLPNWSKIYDVDVWVEAAKQIYFSLGPGFGTLMALSSYNKFNHNCQKDALIAASVNYFASFISGLVIFAVLGYMATIENVDIAEVATEGPGLVFQVYPEGLATMSMAPIWSIFFFIMVITLGIDSTFGGLESVITGLCDEYPRLLRTHRGIFIGLLIVFIYICSLPTTTFGGHYVIFVLESYGTSLSLLFIVLSETIIVCWLYGTDRFCKNLEEMHGHKPHIYWRICWKYISPSILLLIFIAALGQELDKYYTLKSGDYTFPGWAPTLGLLMTGSSLCCVPIYAIYYIKTKTSGPMLERIKTAFRPIEDTCKAERRHRADVLQSNKIRDENDTHQDTDI